jgi:uncharacterized protein with GYD domain
MHSGKEAVMPTYVSLIKWTEQGLKNAKDTVKRAEEVRRRVEQQGGRFHGIYWTQGTYDLVSIIEFPDEETGMAFLLGVGMQGNVRTETLRAFSAEEMQRILQKVP